MKYICDKIIENIQDRVIQYLTNKINIDNYIFREMDSVIQDLDAKQINEFIVKNKLINKYNEDYSLFDKINEDILLEMSDKIYFSIYPKLEYELNKLN